MWVFDGQEWTQEGGQATREETFDKRMPEYGAYLPELQVVDVVPSAPRSYVPMLPNRIPAGRREEKFDNSPVTSIQQPPTTAN